MDHFISLTTAAEKTARFRTYCEEILKEEYQGQNLLPMSETYDRGVFDTLLAKTEATAVRIYYGMDESLKIHAIIVAVNENNEDILPGASLTAVEGEEIINSGVRCPELCPATSPLNSSSLP
jgi:hypothetical protein